MIYLWTEDSGAGFHYWKFVNQYLFEGRLLVESKGSNQGILDSVRALIPPKDSTYYIAFDLVYDNMDVVNKYQELCESAKKYPKQIILLDMICFEYIILSFSKLVHWTGTGKTDKIAMRKDILASLKNHHIDLTLITDENTKEYLMGFKKFSTERVIKSLTNELTENDMWSVKGDSMGGCWHLDCCVSEKKEKTRCKVEAGMSGQDKMLELLSDAETQRILKPLLQKEI